MCTEDEQKQTHKQLTNDAQNILRKREHFKKK